MNQVTVEGRERPEPRERLPRSGVIVITSAVLLVVLVAGLLFSGVRHQLALSLTRVDPAFVEVYFPATTTPAAVCAAVATRRPVPFVIAVHGGSTRAVPYTVEARGTGSRQVRVAGEARGESGAVITRSVTLPVRRAVLQARHVVTITVGGTDQQLLVHCGRGGRVQP